MTENVHPLTEAAERLMQIREHEVGQTLLARPRYGHFRPLDVSIPRWFELFDADVNNFEHNSLTAELAYIVCRLDKTSSEMMDDMILTASIHDIPEDTTGSINGDKQYNLSTLEDEEKEHARLLELASAADFPLTAEEAKKAALIMKDSKIKPEDGGPKTPEGWRFNLVERIGYLRTALIAWEAVEQKQVSPWQRPNVLWMVGNILGNHLSYLMSVRHKSLAVDLLLNGAKDSIDMMVEKLSNRGVQGDIWITCSVTGEGKNRIDPDAQLQDIVAACDDWRQTAEIQAWLKAQV